MGTCGVHGRTVAELTACAGAELRAGDSAAEQAGNVRILGVSEVHTEVRPGDLFVALQGRHHHGAGRVAEAVSYTHLTLPTTLSTCRSRWSPYH